MLRLCLGFLCVAASLFAQWNPSLGMWGKTDQNDIRIMTWNVEDGICSTNPKINGPNNWTALARTVAALRPDVLLIQEAGDNDGNGTGTTLDSVATLTNVVNLFLHGGTDIYRAGNPAVTAYVQLFAPGYDLPHVFVSSVSDGFNRLIILSRYPFQDLNGDTRATMSDIPTITADQWSLGGTGGLRGYQVAEINLPNATYASDLVVGNSHLKAGGAPADATQRQNAARNISYFIEHFYNGAGTGVPDPFGKIADSPAAPMVLPPGTALVTGGDWNEDESSNGTTGPALWITRASTHDSSGGGDGPDRNRSDMLLSSAVDFFTGNDSTTDFGSTFDYLGWQDSVIAARRGFVFNSATIQPALAFPAELVGFSGGGAPVSATAADHRAVVYDFIVPRALGCNTAATDLAFARLGSNGLFPRFAACGTLSTGSNSVFTVSAAPPLTSIFAILAPTQGFQFVAGGTVIPAMPQVFGPFLTDASGSFAIAVPGGGGPFDFYAQWAVLDTLIAGSLSFTNALELHFLP